MLALIHLWLSGVFIVSSEPSRSATSPSAFEAAFACMDSIVEKRNTEAPADEVSALQTNVDVAFNGDELQQGEEVEYENLLRDRLKAVLQPDIAADEILQSTRTHSKDERSWTVEFTFGLAELSILLVIALVRELGMARNWFGRHEDVRPRHRSFMKGVEVLRVTIASSDYTWIIPFSLNFARTLGNDLLVSGFIVGTYTSGTAAGICLARQVMQHGSHTVQRRSMVLLLAFSAVCEAALAVLMTIPNLSAGKIMIWLVLVRFIAGSAAGFGSMHLLMLSRSCTPAEMNKFDPWLPPSDYMGLVLGLILTAFCMTTTEPSTIYQAVFTQREDIFQACSTPMMTIACLNMLVSLGISFSLPVDLDEVTSLHDDMPCADDSADCAPDILAADVADVLTDEDRETIAWQAILQVGLCSLSTVGCELVTPYLMEVEYHFTPVSIALGMSVMFTCTCIIVTILTLCRMHWGTSVDIWVGGSCGALASIATSLYFLNTYGRFEDKYHLLIGDSFVYPCITVVTGMMVGYGLWSANSERWNKRDTINLTARMADAGLKSIGAPLGRALACWGGRTPYALVQLTIILLSLVNFMWVRNFSMHMEKTRLEHAVPKGENFFKEVKSGKDRLGNLLLNRDNGPLCGSG